MKLYPIIFFLIILSSFISGCTERENKANSERNPYLLIINKLTAEEMKGRLTGTEGNQKAVDFIKEEFASAKLDPVFDQSYLHAYKHSFYNPETQKFGLSIHYENEEMKLVHEKDFLEQSSVQSLQLQLPICPQQEEWIKHDCIFITKDSFPSNNSYIKGVLRSKSIFTKYLSTNVNGLPIFQIHEELYERIILNFETIKKVEMSMELSNELIEAHNVVGKITGTGHGDHRDAIIVSAHLDSVGSIGDKHIEGAIDNATGVASLIQLAYKLKQHSLSNEFQSDIIFVAFNGEESGLQGSKAFVEDIAKSYKNITNINIDSIGNKGLDEYLIIGSENGQALRERLIGYLSEQQFNIIEDNPSLTSDHVAFSNKHYPAITIGQNKLDTMHTHNDKKDSVDVNKLQEIVTVLFNYIVDTEGEDIEIIYEEFDVNEELIQLANEEIDNLEFGQYKNMGMKIPGKEYDAVIFIFNGELAITSLSSIPESLNWLKIQDYLKEYTFNRANVHFTITPDDYFSLELNKVYGVESFTEADFNSLNVTYLDVNSEGYEILISTQPIHLNEKNKMHTYGEQEYIVYNYDSYLTIHTTHKWDTKTYYYVISKIRQMDEEGNVLLWTTEDIDQALETIDSFDLVNWTKQMGL